MSAINNFLLPPSLPNELWVHIGSFLNNEEYSVLGSINKNMQSLYSQSLPVRYKETYGDIGDDVAKIYNTYIKNFVLLNKAPLPDPFQKRLSNLEYWKWILNLENCIDRELCNAFKVFNKTRPSSILQMKAKGQLFMQIGDHYIQYLKFKTTRKNACKATQIAKVFFAVLKFILSFLYECSNHLEKYRLFAQKRDMKGVIGSFPLNNKVYKVIAVSLAELEEYRIIIIDSENLEAYFKRKYMEHQISGLFTTLREKAVMPGSSLISLDNLIRASDQSGIPVSNKRHLELAGLRLSKHFADSQEIACLDQKLIQIFIEIALQNNMISLRRFYEDGVLASAAGFQEGIFVLKDLKIKNVLFKEGEAESWAEIIARDPILTPQAAVLPEYWTRKPNIVNCETQ